MLQPATRKILAHRLEKAAISAAQLVARECERGRGPTRAACTRLNGSTRSAQLGPASGSSLPSPLRVGTAWGGGDLDTGDLPFGVRSRPEPARKKKHEKEEVPKRDAEKNPDMVTTDSCLMGSSAGGPEDVQFKTRALEVNPSRPPPHSREIEARCRSR